MLNESNKTMKLKIENLCGQDESHLIEVPEFLNCKLTLNTANAFKKMIEAAKKDGLIIKPISSFRNFERQLTIWNEKYMGDRKVLDNHNKPLDIGRLTGVEAVYAILFWSALPGFSRHHWGTDIDVVAENLIPEGYELQLISSEYEKDGIFYPLTRWLDQHMDEFGFFRPFTDDAHVRVGTELWHLSYKADAQEFEKLITKDTIKNLISNTPIAGKVCLSNMVDELYDDYIIHQ